MVPPGKAQTSLHAYTRRAPHAPDTRPFSPLASPRHSPRAFATRATPLVRSACPYPSPPSPLTAGAAGPSQRPRSPPSRGRSSATFSRRRDLVSDLGPPSRPRPVVSQHPSTARPTLHETPGPPSSNTPTPSFRAQPLPTLPPGGGPIVSVLLEIADGGQVTASTPATSPSTHNNINMAVNTRGNAQLAQTIAAHVPA